VSHNTRASTTPTHTYPLSLSPDLVIPGQQPLPVVIDWEYWQKRRQLVLRVNPDIPQYLVLPEIHAVLEHALNQELHFLLNLLWHTGARISEALAITREDLVLETVRDSLVILANAKRKAGRPSKRKGHDPKRIVPITDARFIDEARRYLATTQPKQSDKIFTLNRQQVHYQLQKIEGEVTLPVASLSAHTFRHSFAVNLLLQGRGIRVVQSLLGHADLASTEVYLKVLSGETHHLLYGMQF
jgi:site-specific recombinase XerD